MAVVGSRSIRPAERQEARVGITPAPMPNATLDTSVGRQIAGFGQALSSLSDHAAKMQREKEDFQASNDYKALELALNADLAQQQENAAGTSADAFHQQFIENTYKPRRDEFMAKLPERLREKYNTILNDSPDQPGSAFVHYDVTAAASERSLRNDWYRAELDKSKDELAKAIAVDPEGFERFMALGTAEIENSGLPTGEKAKRIEDWKNFAEVAYVDQLLEKRPEDVLRALDVDPRQLTPTGQMALLESVMIGVESSGNPNAVSPKGAIGLMQVLPATGAEIAKELGDRNFPANPEAAARYLADPEVNRRYGMYYLKKQLKAFNGDLEAALIAYNGGPERAKAWLEAGRDDRVIPEESAKYYKKIIDRMRSASSLDAEGNPVPGTAPSFRSMPLKAANQYLHSILAPGKPSTYIDDMEPAMQERLAALLQAAPPNIRRDLGISSGARSVARQAELWKAAVKKYGSEQAARKWVAPPGHSNHNHGKAADLSYKGERLDMAPNSVKRWLHDNAGQYGLHFPLGHEVWHIELAGTRGTKDVNGYTGRVNNLTYQQRAQYVAKAEAAIAAKATPSVTPVMKVEVRRDMANELALYKATGAGSGNFDETRIASALGEDDYNKYVYQRDQAQRIYVATSPLKEMSSGELATIAEDYAPTPGSPGFAADSEVQAAVEKEVERITKLRAKNPGEAALEFKDVIAAKEALEAPLAKGEMPPPADVQKFVALMLERQTAFDIPKAARAPIPDAWAMEIGRVISAGPALGEAKPDEVRAAVAQLYDQLQSVYGEYADEVITYALSVYKGMDEPTAEMVTGLMAAIGRGRDPADVFRLQKNAELAKEEPSFWSKLSSWFADDDETAEETTNPELLRRAIESLRTAETPEDRDAIRARYGDKVFNAAERQVDQ